MYGTQRAAEVSQEDSSSALLSVRLLQGSASACVFRHPAKNITGSLHGDDFTAAGLKSRLVWFEARMKQRYELTAGGRLGPADEHCKEAFIVNRFVLWTATGI